MHWLLDASYLLALMLLSPWLVYKALTTGKYRRGLRAKLLGPGRPGIDMPRSPVWFHGVSVGEVHLLRQVIKAFRERQPEQPIVLSTTTDTGFDEARRCFPDLKVIHFPFDFTWAVHRSLSAVGPRCIVLAENELWPNFLRAANALGVPVAVINGRMSPRSFRRWRRLRFVARRLLGRIDLLAMQTEEYARNAIGLGADAAKVKVTGSVKYDGVTMDRGNRRTRELAKLFSVGAEDLVWIAGSTQTPEEEIVLQIYQRLRMTHAHLRLFLVPRQKDRFDEVARLLEDSGEAFVRRSAMQSSLADGRNPIILGDTIGELSALWGLADVAFVGGSMDGQRGGQNMIEPAAYGAAVVFGPHVWNFQDAADRLQAAGGALQVQNAAELETVVGELLDNPAARRTHGVKAQAFVVAQQGATTRTVDLLERLLLGHAHQERAA